MKKLFFIAAITVLWGCGKDLPTAATTTVVVKTTDSTNNEIADPSNPDNDAWNNEMQEFGPV